MRVTKGVPTTNGDRAKGVVAAVVLPGLLGYALLTGLGVAMPVVTPDQRALVTFELTPPPPPPAIVPERIKSTRPEGKAAPPNLRSKATELVAPPPIIPPIAPPPVVVALKPGPGVQATSGASTIAGPGTGAGGIGDGFGSGGAGDGDSGGDETPPRWRRGRMRDSDFPRAAADAGFSGIVSIRFLVGTNGRVARCAITRSSGRADVDRTTCRLISDRYRFDPSRDASGRPVPAWVVEDHTWVFEAVPAEEE